MRTKVIVNPKSAGGNTEKNWPQLENKLRSRLGEFDYEFTSGQNAATEISRGAIKAGYQKIVALGGDGTLSETVNGFFENTGRPLNPETIFSFIMCGRGNDFRKTFGIKDDIDQAIARAAGKNIINADVGRVTYLAHNGQEQSRFFINLASFGMSGGVVDKVNKGAGNFLGGTGAFLLASLQTLVSYENKQIELNVDGQVRSGRMRMVAIANGQYAGGGMHFAPGARVDDGLFDVIIMGDIDKLDSALSTSKLFEGKILEHPKVEKLQGRKITATSNEEVLIDIDGEQPGRLPATFEIMPGALRLQC